MKIILETNIITDRFNNVIAYAYYKYTVTGKTIWYDGCYLSYGNTFKTRIEAMNAITKWVERMETEVIPKVLEELEKEEKEN